MSSRLKSLGFPSRRKNGTNSPQNENNKNNNNSNRNSTNNVSHSPPPQLPPVNNASSGSLPMNNPNNLGRPPSYSYNPGSVRPNSPLPPGQQQQQAQHPPPVNTTAGYGQHPTAGAGTTLPLPPHGQGQGQQPPGYSGYPVQASQHGGMAPQITPYTGRLQPGGELDATGRAKAQLIVGIDLGTTFSGVAYAFATNTEAREDIITEWPGAGTHTKQKVRYDVFCCTKK